MSRIEWTEGRWSLVGQAGGWDLFAISWGTKRQDAMWHLSTTLPVPSPRLGQHYVEQDDAKAAAERILAAFIRRIDKGAP